MKNILISSMVAIGLLSGCAHMGSKKEEMPTTKVVELKTMTFKGVKDKKYKAMLISGDHFETAVLTDTKGNKHDLKIAVSGSGVRLANDEGVEIHFKKGEGVINLGKGQKDIFVTYEDQ